MQSTRVSQFNQERFPLTMSVPWNPIVTSAAIPAIGWGAKKPNGMITSTTWLMTTPAL